MGNRKQETGGKVPQASSKQIRMASAAEGESHTSIPHTPTLLQPPYNFRSCKTRLEHSGPYFLPDVIAAIRVTGGNFLEMSSLLGRRRTAVRDFVYATLEAKDAWDEERESMLDRVEQALQEVAIQERDPASLRFLASTLGKDRGYTPKVEHSGSDGKPMVFEVVFSDPSSQSLESLTDAQKKERLINELMESGLPVSTN